MSTQVRGITTVFGIITASHQRSQAVTRLRMGPNVGKKEERQGNAVEHITSEEMEDNQSVMR
jgi:hypothetical protein